MVKVNTSGRGGSRTKPQKRRTNRRETPRRRREIEDEYDDYEEDDYEDEYDDYDDDYDDYYDDDDDYYDDDDDEEDDRRKGGSGKTKFFIGAGVIGVIVVLAIIMRLMGGGDKPQEEKKEEPKTEQKEKKQEQPKSDQKQEEETSESKGLGREEEAAKKTLEHPDQLGTVEDKTNITNRLKESSKKILEEKDKFKNNEDGGLSLTGYSMLSNFKLALQHGYEIDYDSVSAYKSDTDGVIQYTFKMKNKDNKVIAFSGNYLNSTKQMELAIMKGKLVLPTSEQLASPGNKDGKQYDPEKAKKESDKPLHPEKVQG